MQSLYVIDVTRGYLSAALLTAVAYAREGGEALLVRGNAEHKLVRAAVERFRPARIASTAGATPPLHLGAGGDDRIAVEILPAEEASLLSWMMTTIVEQARGVVFFPSHSPSWAIKAAALAVRLGYLIWPLEEAAGFARAAPSGIPILMLGEAPGNLADTLQGREFRHLPGDRAVAIFLKEMGLPINYVVAINSADLEIPTYSSPAMGTFWTQGLSLLAPLLASYRQAWVIDARTPRPEARDIERTLNQKVSDAGVIPEYLALLGSPGALPYLVKPNPMVGATEDLIREIHLRLSNNIFCDVAEGRLFGASAGKVSMQILSTKYFAALPNPHRARALICGRPKTDGVVFAIDEAVGRTQVRPLLEQAGFSVTELYGADCSPQQIAKHLPRSGLMLYGGHGHPDSLSTHAMPLYTETLPPEVAPGVVYACACSTLYPKPARHSSDGGFSFEEDVIPYPEQIGPAFIDRGALAFVGGLTAEDVLLNTPMYVVFTQALVLKGMSVGQAVRAARNYSLLHLALLSQTSTSAFNSYRIGLAHSVQQQALLGDPAFRPYSGTAKARLPLQAEQDETSLTLRVSIPDQVWVREKVKVDSGRCNEEFHRSRIMEAWIPVGEDIYNWGETYTVARDVADLSDTGVLGSCLHLHADLPLGRVPVSLELEAVETTDGECLLCRQVHPNPDGRSLFTKYVLPFQRKEPPVAYDQESNWSFATEETPAGLRIHWLAPTLVIADTLRRAVRVRSISFRLHHEPGVRMEGRLELGQAAGLAGGFAPAAMEGTRGLLPDDLLLSFGRLLTNQTSEPEAGKNKKPRLAVLAQTLSGPGGRWACWLPKRAEMGVRIDLPLPVHRYAVTVLPGFLPDIIPSVPMESYQSSIRLKAAETGILRGTVLEIASGRSLPGAQIRVWRGNSGGRNPVFEHFVTLITADAHGRFELTLPTGSYLLQTTHRTEFRFLAGKATATLYRERETPVLIGMEPGGVVTGKVTFEGPYQPKRSRIRLAEHGKPDEIVASGLVRRDGSFELLAPSTRPFVIQISQEGFESLIDTNDGKGFHLAPGETLQRDLSVIGKEKS